MNLIYNWTASWTALVRHSGAVLSGVYEKVKNCIGFVRLGPDKQEDTNSTKPNNFSRRVTERMAPSNRGGPTRCPVTLISLLTCGIKLLEEAGIEGAKLDAEVLLAHTLNISRFDIYLSRNELIDKTRSDLFLQCIKRRKNRCPVAYITGLKEFWSLSIRVNEHVLIPRPETELVVEEALLFFKKSCASRTTLHTSQILDLCTGSGCIAAALAKELPNARICVSDISEEALNVARGNLAFAKNRVKFIPSDLFENIPDSEKFDVITANPPYIAIGDKPTLSPEIAYEPEGALFGGKSGLDFTTKIINDAHRFLKRGGQLIMEIGIGQSAALTEAAQNLGRYSLIETKKDLAGIDRVWKSYL